MSYINLKLSLDAGLSKELLAGLTNITDFGKTVSVKFIIHSN